MKIEEEKIETKNAGNTEPVEPIERPLTAVNWTVLKDLGDISRARNLFFMPFFGALLAFIVAKSDYIISSNIIIQAEVLITFCLGVLYAWIVTKHMVMLESIRFVQSANVTSEGFVFSNLSKKELEAITKAGYIIQAIIKGEQVFFKWTMRALWITTGTVFIDIFFGKWLGARLTEILLYSLSHWHSNAI